jgi:hypothetical protein
MTSNEPESIKAVQHSGWYTVRKGSFAPGHAESVTYSERIGSFADANLDDSDAERVERSEQNTCVPAQGDADRETNRIGTFADGEREYPQFAAHSKDEGSFADANRN